MGKKQKYYAIKVGNNVKDLIVDSWSECEKYVLNVPNRYKSFGTMEEAEAYLKTAPDTPQGSFKPYRKEDKVKAEVYITEDVLRDFTKHCQSKKQKVESIIETLIVNYLQQEENSL